MSEPDLVVGTESKYGQPFKEMLIDYCEEHGTVTEVAAGDEPEHPLRSRYDLSRQDIRFEVLKQKASA